jgi:hypothetical protein
LYPNDIEKYIGFLEIVLAIGEMGAPNGSGALYDVFATDPDINPFKWAMVLIGSFGLFSLAVTIFLIPSAYNNTVSDEEIESNRSTNKKSELEITAFKVISQKECFFAIMAVFFGAFNIKYYDGWMDNFANDFDEWIHYEFLLIY